MVKEGAKPNRLITIAVMAGVRIIKYRGAVRSAMIPIRGFKSQGTRMIRSHMDAIARLSPNFSINKGLSGAKKDE
jgi:hypothetical protein